MLLVSLVFLFFNYMSTFMGNLMPNSSLEKNNSDSI